MRRGRRIVRTTSCPAIIRRLRRWVRIACWKRFDPARRTSTRGQEGNSSMMRRNGSMIRRRSIGWGALAACVVLGGIPAWAAPTPISVGVTLPLTGTDTEDSKFIEQGFQMAIDEANAAHQVPGHEL